MNQLILFIHKAEEESQYVKSAAMNKQGSWMRWERVWEKVLTWQDIWTMEEHRIKFLLCSMFARSYLPT